MGNKNVNKKEENKKIQEAKKHVGKVSLRLADFIFYAIAEQLFGVPFYLTDVVKVPKAIFENTKTCRRINDLELIVKRSIKNYVSKWDIGETKHERLKRIKREQYLIKMTEEKVKRKMLNKNTVTIVND